jgi:hypothetical protein
VHPAFSDEKWEIISMDLFPLGDFLRQVVIRIKTSFGKKG